MYRVYLINSPRARLIIHCRVHCRQIQLPGVRGPRSPAGWELRPRGLRSIDPVNRVFSNSFGNRLR